MVRRIDDIMIIEQTSPNQGQLLRRAAVSGELLAPDLQTELEAMASERNWGEKLRKNFGCFLCSVFDDKSLLPTFILVN